MRLEDCRVQSKANTLNRAVAGRSLDLLRHLLLTGPYAAAAEALDLIQAIRCGNTTIYYSVTLL